MQCETITTVGKSQYLLAGKRGTYHRPLSRMIIEGVIHIQPNAVRRHTSLWIWRQTSGRCVARTGKAIGYVKAARAARQRQTEPALAVRRRRAEAPDLGGVGGWGGKNGSDVVALRKNGSGVYCILRIP